MAALPFAGALVLAGPVLAQTAQGQFTPDNAAAPIQLHMPVHLHAPARHRASARPKVKTAAPADAAATPPPKAGEAATIPFGGYAAPTTPPAAAPHRAAAVSKPARRTQETAVASAPASRAERRKAVQEVLSDTASTVPSSGTAADVSAPDAAIPFSFDATTAPQPTPKAKAPLRAVPRATHSSGAPAHPRTSVAALEAPPKATPPEPKPQADPHAGLVKKGEILFAGTSTDPQADGAGEVKTIAGNLNSAMDSENARVEIEAFGGAPGDKSSDARRLSLRRALAVRQLLIDSGIPASRIDVRALGGIDDHGNADRVDLYLRGAS